jgi:hypothetical protein
MLSYSTRTAHSKVYKTGALIYRLCESYAQDRTAKSETLLRTERNVEIYDSDFVSSYDDVAKSLELHCSILRCQLQEKSTTERRGADAPNTVDFNVNGVALNALRHPAIQYIISI